jgi:hypothetical protein
MDFGFMANIADIRRAGRNIGEIRFKERLEFLAMASVITVGNTESASARPFFLITECPFTFARFLTYFEQLDLSDDRSTSLEFHTSCPQ